VQTASAPSALKADGQDLISRYNLSEKASSPHAEAEDQPATSSKASWAQNKEERQRLLQKRRDDMILAARRRMMQKDQNGAQ
jgi:coupling of ubiquitin conjugation to ER degradation protein 1